MSEETEIYHSLTGYSRLVYMPVVVARMTHVALSKRVDALIYPLTLMRNVSVCRTWLDQIWSGLS